MIAPASSVPICASPFAGPPETELANADAATDKVIAITTLAKMSATTSSARRCRMRRAAGQTNAAYASGLSARST